MIFQCFHAAGHRGDIPMLTSKNIFYAQKPEGDEVTHTHITFIKVSTIIRREFVVKAKHSTIRRRKQSYKKVNAGKTGTNTSKTACKLH